MESLTEGKDYSKVNIFIIELGLLRFSHIRAFAVNNENIKAKIIS
jgi:hypothetical protein